MAFWDKITSPFGGNIIVTLIVFLVGGLITTQLISLLLTQVFGITMLKMGLGLTLLSLGAPLVMIYLFAVSTTIDKNAIISLILVFGIMMFFVFLAPKLVPSIYEQSILQMKTSTMSLLGLS